MKKNFVLTLLALSMLCVLTTGCGSRKDDTAGTTGSTVQDTMNDPTNNGTGSTIMDEAEQGLENAGDAITGNGSSSSGNSSASSGSSSSSSSNGATSGVPYDELLNDGKVTDRDGNLNNNASGSTSAARRR